MFENVLGSHIVRRLHGNTLQLTLLVGLTPYSESAPEVFLDVMEDILFWSLHPASQ